MESRLQNDWKIFPGTLSDIQNIWKFAIGIICFLPIQRQIDGLSRKFILNVGMENDELGRMKLENDFLK